MEPTSNEQRALALLTSGSVDFRTVDCVRCGRSGLFLQGVAVKDGLGFLYTLCRNCNFNSHLVMSMESGKKLDVFAIGSTADLLKKHSQPPTPPSGPLL